MARGSKSGAGDRPKGSHFTLYFEPVLEALRDLRSVGPASRGDEIH